MVALEDASGFRGEAERVFAPASEAELLEIIAAAAQGGTSITIGGARTGLTGGCVPQGGWAVSLEKFRRLEICPGRAIAGPGVELDTLQLEAARTGQFYAPDPTEIAQLSLWQHAPPRSRAASGADGWQRSESTPRRQSRF